MTRRWSAPTLYVHDLPDTDPFSQARYVDELTGRVTDDVTNDVTNTEPATTNTATTAPQEVVNWLANKCFDVYSNCCPCLETD